MKGYRHLTLVHRCIIEGSLRQGRTLSEIANLCGVHRSTISREIKRATAVKTGVYNALGAECYSKQSHDRRCAQKSKLVFDLEELVIDCLQRGWSPEQICGRLKLEGRKTLCHETIYRWIYRNLDRSGLRQVLRRYRERPRRGLKRQRRYLKNIPRKTIGDRSLSVEKRNEIGHWERDLLLGKQSGPALLTMIERKTRFTLIRQVPSKHCAVVNRVSAQLVQDHPELLFKTMTNDNGGEFGQPHSLEAETGMSIYFCHPHSPWQRGSIENLNGLLRQYLPKGSDLKATSDEELLQIQDEMNHRPRKLLHFRTPYELMMKKTNRLLKSDRLYKQLWIEKENAYTRRLLEGCCT